MLLTNQLVVAIGQSLIAFLWQGAVVGLLAALLLRLLRSWDPRWRYALACAALVVMVVIPVRTTLTNYVQTPTPTLSDHAVVPPLPEPEEGGGYLVVDESEDAATGSGNAAAPIGGIDRVVWLRAIVTLWLIGVALLSLRLAGGWVLVRRMTRQGRLVDAELATLVRSVAARLQLPRRILARQSVSVRVPTVVGWLKPTILLPVSAIAGLSPEQLEAILAHELAHVRRHDYGINLLQRAAETVLFYHPAVWWLSGRIRAEREMCADDLAVSVCGDASLYAGALRDLEAARRPNALAMAATGGSLASRIGRLLGQPPARDRWSPAWTIILLVGVIVVAGAGSPGSTTEASTPASPPPAPIEAPELVPAGSPAIEETAEEEAPTTQDDGVVSASTAPLAEPVVSVLPAPAPVPAPAGTAVQSIFLSSSRNGVLGLAVVDGETEGARVESVSEESPAAQAGIETGDVITAFAGTPVLGAKQLARLVEETPDGRTIPLTLVRDGETRAVDVTVDRSRASFYSVNEGIYSLNDGGVRIVEPFGYAADPRISVFSTRTVRLGLAVENMTPELREFFGAPEDRGVLVASVQEDSPSAEAGVLVGDVIVSVDGNPVASRADLSWQADLDDPTVVLEVIRERRSQEVRVTPELPRQGIRITF